MSDPAVPGLVAWDFGRPKGGMGRSLQWIVSALREAAIDVRIGAPVPDASASPLLPVTRRIGGHLLFSLLLPCVLRRWIRQSGVTRLLLPAGPGGVLLVVRPPVPYDVIVYHSYAQQWRAVPGQWWKRLLVPLERRTVRGARRVLCFCADTARVLRREMGVGEEKIRVVGHAIAQDEGRRTKDKFQISNFKFQNSTFTASSPAEDRLCVCIARLEERKGVRVLLEAWHRVAAAVPDARLVLVGSGVQAERIDRMIASLQGGSVQRIASLPQAELDRLLHAAQVAVCPSFLEGFGLAAAEAMAAGIAVIASDVDGLRSLVDHERTGLLVPPGDAEALAAAIIRLLSDDALRARVGAAARVDVRARFDPAACGRAVVEAIV